MIKFIKDLFTRVFNWIKTKINKVFKSSMVKLTIDRIKTIKKSKSYQILKDIDITDLVTNTISKEISIENNKSIDPDTDLTAYISQFFKNAPSYYLSLVFNSDNKVYKLSDIIKFIDEGYNHLKESDKDGFQTAINIIIKNQPREIKYTYGNLIEYVDQLPELVNQAEKYYQDKYKELSNTLNTKIKELSEISGENFNNEIYTNKYNEIMFIKRLLNMVQIPITCISLYIFILTVVLNKNFIKKYLSVPYLDKERLFHLSNHSDLDAINNGVLNNNGTTKPKDILPSSSNNLFTNKISFGKTIEQCAAGIGFRLDQDREYYDLYLYEGIPDKDTLQLLPSLVAAEVGEYFFTNEVAIVTPIKIRKLGKVRIWVDSNKNKYDPSRYYDIKFLEGGL